MRDSRKVKAPPSPPDYASGEAERAAAEQEIREDYAARNRAMFPLAGFVALHTLLLIVSLFHLPEDDSPWAKRDIALVLTAALGPIALAKCGFCFIAMGDNRGYSDYRGRLPAAHRRTILAGSLTLGLLALLTAPRLLFGSPALDFLLPFRGELPLLPPWALIPLFNAPALLLAPCAVDRLTCRPRPG